METSDLHNKSRNELREALRKKGLSPSGVKEDLIKRLEGSVDSFQATNRKPSDNAISDSHRSTDDEQLSPHPQMVSQSIPINQGQKRERDFEEATHPSVPIFTRDETPICGHPNKYGKPCQRVGRYCPYHGVIKGALQNNATFSSEAHVEPKNVLLGNVRYSTNESDAFLPLTQSVSALPTSLHYSTSITAHKRKGDHYNEIVDALTNRPTKKFKSTGGNAMEDLARQRFLQHAALEFERLKEEQQHQTELNSLQQQIETMRQNSQQKDKVIESLEKHISEMNKMLVATPEKIPFESLSRWRENSQNIHDEQVKNVF